MIKINMLGCDGLRFVSQNNSAMQNSEVFI